MALFDDDLDPTSRALFSTFQFVWGAAVDASTSDDFRTDGQLDEAKYVGYQRRVFEEAATKARIAMVVTLPLHALHLSPRVVNRLEGDHIFTVGDLARRTEYDLLDIREFGQKALDEVKAKLKPIGLELSPHHDTSSPVRQIDWADVSSTETQQQGGPDKWPMPHRGGLAIWKH